MKVYKNLARAAAAVLALSSLTMPASAYSDFILTLNALTGPTPSIVDLGSHSPVITENDSLVPIRPLAEGAGMTASWDQPTQTATMTLYSCSWADNNVERYAAKLMDDVYTYGLDVDAYSISADFKINDNVATLRYNYKDAEGDIVSIGKKVEVDEAATLVNDGTLMVPLKSSMELFGLDVELDNDEMSADISIPDYIRTPSDMGFIADNEPVETPAPAPVQTYVQPVQETHSVEVTSPDQGVNMDPKLGKFLGRFMITHYCTCSICNGGWGANTAWAGKITPGRTIAVDPAVIPKLATVYIEGYGYRVAEDCGGAIKGNHIDMAVGSHSEAISLGVVYRDVYLAD
jgi:3D (Asp-Asp-Asp) domain-containing protein